jgi:HPt (histidine-containing phosphotransfer) domain-containing protein
MSIPRSEVNALLNASLAILNGDIANGIAPAIQNINKWSQLLKMGGDTAYDTIAADLQQLEAYLTAGDVSPITSTLHTLAEHLVSIDDDANPFQIEPLHALAQRLSDVARELQTMADQQQQ